MPQEIYGFDERNYYILDDVWISEKIRKIIDNYLGRGDKKSQPYSQRAVASEHLNLWEVQLPRKRESIQCLLNASPTAPLTYSVRGQCSTVPDTSLHHASRGQLGSLRSRSAIAARESLQGGGMFVSRSQRHRADAQDSRLERARVAPTYRGY